MSNFNGNSSGGGTTGDITVDEITIGDVPNEYKFPDATGEVGQILKLTPDRNTLNWSADEGISTPYDGSIVAVDFVTNKDVNPTSLNGFIADTDLELQALKTKTNFIDTNGGKFYGDVLMDKVDFSSAVDQEVVSKKYIDDTVNDAVFGGVTPLENRVAILEDKTTWQSVNGIVTEFENNLKADNAMFVGENLYLQNNNPFIYFGTNGVALNAQSNGNLVMNITDKLLDVRCGLFTILNNNTATSYDLFAYLDKVNDNETNIGNNDSDITDLQTKTQYQSAGGNLTQWSGNIQSNQVYALDGFRVKPGGNPGAKGLFMDASNYLKLDGSVVNLVSTGTMGINASGAITLKNVHTINTTQLGLNTNTIIGWTGGSSIQDINGSLQFTSNVIRQNCFTIFGTGSNNSIGTGAGNILSINADVEVDIDNKIRLSGADGDRSILGTGLTITNPTNGVLNIDPTNQLNMSSADINIVSFGTINVEGTAVLPITNDQTDLGQPLQAFKNIYCDKTFQNSTRSAIYDFTERDSNFTVPNGEHVLYYNSTDHKLHVKDDTNDFVFDLEALSNNESEKLSVTGGTMAGILDMNNNRITNVPIPSNSTDVVSKAYADGRVDFFNKTRTIRFKPRDATDTVIYENDDIKIWFRYDGSQSIKQPMYLLKTAVSGGVCHSVRYQTGSNLKCASGTNTYTNTNRYFTSTSYSTNFDSSYNVNDNARYYLAISPAQDLNYPLIEVDLHYGSNYCAIAKVQILENTGVGFSLDPAITITDPPLSDDYDQRLDELEERFNELTS